MAFSCYFGKEKCLKEQIICSLKPEIFYGGLSVSMGTKQLVDCRFYEIFKLARVAISEPLTSLLI